MSLLDPVVSAAQTHEVGRPRLTARPRDDVVDIARPSWCAASGEAAPAVTLPDEPDQGQTWTVHARGELAGGIE